MEGCLTRRPQHPIPEVNPRPAAKIAAFPANRQRSTGGTQVEKLLLVPPEESSLVWGGCYQMPDRRLKLPTCSAELTLYRYLTAVRNSVKPQFLIHHNCGHFKRKAPPRPKFSSKFAILPRTTDFPIRDCDKWGGPSPHRATYSRKPSRCGPSPTPIFPQPLSCLAAASDKSMTV
jgi:hypothetical protein